MVKAKRRLADLYVIGTPVEFDDGQGDPIKVFVRKLSPVDHDKAVKRANAARSRVKVLSRGADKTSEEYLELRSEVDSWGKEDLINYLVMVEKSDREPILEAELSAEEEWSEDAYLIGLKDAWLEGLKDTYAKDPEDSEAARVFAELARFDAALDDLVNGEMEAFTKDLESKSEEDLREDAFKRSMDIQASMSWVNEYRRCEVWLSTREEDQKTPYFESREEVDSLPFEVYLKLASTYRDLAVDPMEGKALQETDTSSSLSAPQENQDQDPLSGPLDAIV